MLLRGVTGFRAMARLTMRSIAGARRPHKPSPTAAARLSGQGPHANIPGVALSTGAVLGSALLAFEYTIGDEAPTLDAALGLSPWPVVAAVVLRLGVWLVRNRPAEPEHGKWCWPVTGGAIGLVIVLGWYLSAWAGNPTGIAFAPNTGHLLTYPMVGYPSRPTWGMALLVGVVGGAALAAWRTGEFAWKAVPGFTGVKLFAGGLAMGVGALIVDGCNITQGLTNSSTLGLGGLTAFAAMLAGDRVALRALYGRD